MQYAPDLHRTKAVTVRSTCEDCNWTHHAHYARVTIGPGKRRDVATESTRTARHHARATGHTVVVERKTRVTLTPRAQESA